MSPNDDFADVYVFSVPMRDKPVRTGDTMGCGYMVAFSIMMSENLADPARERVRW